MAELLNRDDPSTTLCDVVGHERIVVDESDECSIDKTNTLSFKVFFVIGAAFTCLSGLISFYMNRVGPRKLVGRSPSSPDENSILFEIHESFVAMKMHFSKLDDIFINSMTFVYHLDQILVGWLVISALCSFGLNYITELYSILSVFIISVSCSLVAAITMGMSVSVYSTNVRAMATSFVFMCGRIGGLMGANFVSLLLEYQCTMIFNLCGVFVISKLQVSIIVFVCAIFI